MEKSWNVTSYGLLGGGFKYCLCSPLLGEMIPFHQYFSDGLKPPCTRNGKVPISLVSAGYIADIYEERSKSILSSVLEKIDKHLGKMIMFAVLTNDYLFKLAVGISPIGKELSFVAFSSHPGVHAWPEGRRAENTWENIVIGPCIFIFISLSVRIA